MSCLVFEVWHSLASRQMYGLRKFDNLSIFENLENEYPIICTHNFGSTKKMLLFISSIYLPIKLPSLLSKGNKIDGSNLFAKTANYLCFLCTL